MHPARRNIYEFLFLLIWHMYISLTSRGNVLWFSKYIGHWVFVPYGNLLCDAYHIHFNFCGVKLSRVASYRDFCIIISQITDFRDCSFLPASATNVDKPSQIWDIPHLGIKNERTGILRLSIYTATWRNYPVTAHMWTYDYLWHNAWVWRGYEYFTTKENIALGTDTEHLCP